jgi:hypothetical protein
MAKRRKKKRGMIHKKKKRDMRFRSREEVDCPDEVVVGRRQIMQKLEYFLGTGLRRCVACELAGRAMVPSY